ncbi:MAG: hypothetical protein EOO21_02255, partial [Comamonadaceae bacterium]
MRWPAHACSGWWMAALLLLGLAAFLPVRAEPRAQMAAMAQPTVTLRDAAGSIDARGLPFAWIDAEGHATIEEVAEPAGPARFAAAAPDTIHTLGPAAAAKRAGPAGSATSSMVA